MHFEILNYLYRFTRTRLKKKKKMADSFVISTAEIRFKTLISVKPFEMNSCIQVYILFVHFYKILKP